MLSGLDQSQHIGQPRLQPTQQRAGGTVSDPQPDDDRRRTRLETAQRKIFVFRDDDSTQIKRARADIRIFCMPKPESLTMQFVMPSIRQHPSQRWRQLGVDDEPHRVARTGWSASRAA
jgi:hypothetical protein